MDDKRATPAVISRTLLGGRQIYCISPDFWMAESSGDHVPQPRYRPDVSGRHSLPPLCSNVSILAAGVGQGNCKKGEVGRKTLGWRFYERFLGRRGWQGYGYLSVGQGWVLSGRRLKRRFT